MGGVLYQLDWPDAPKPISDSGGINSYTMALQAFIGNLEETIQDFLTKLGPFVNTSLLQKFGDVLLGQLDCRKGDLLLPTYTGDPAGELTAGIYYETGTDHVRARFASSSDSLAKYGEVFLRELSAINQAIAQGGVATTVTFGTAQTNASYGVVVTPNWNTSWWVTSKSTTSFTINWGTAAPASASADFLVWR